jgi:hypothetical protein
MDFELRVVVEKVAVSTQEIIQRDTIKVYDVTPPESILDLGLRHSEQISLLEKIQNSILAEQSKLIERNLKTCPNCGHKLSRNGYTHSKFHAVFSDHELQLQKHRCNNPECRWQRVPTITFIFGTNIHPDLAKLQCEQGALFSYREAQSNLDKLNTYHRSVNNHTQISRLTDQVGAILSQQHLIPPVESACAQPTQELILQVDGGHIPLQERAKRSFEALSAIVYRPESLQVVDQHHREILNKSCVLSAKDDKLETMNSYVFNAAHQQGMNQNTVVTALADGAKNCWSVIASLKPYCQKLEPLLDWFHIGKKFQTVKHALGASFEDCLASCKWNVWHGNVEESLIKLEMLMLNISDDEKCSKLKGLYNYLKQNQDYIVNYDERKRLGKTFTSQVAESHIESIINARHKKSGKMQWSREGAHNVLQIRSEIISKTWTQQWQQVVLSALGAAV